MLHVAFTLMREARKLRPELVIYDGDDKTFADLSEENELDTYYYRLDNMANIIEKQDAHIGVNGLVHEFHIFPEYIKAQMPEKVHKNGHTRHLMTSSTFSGITKTMRTSVERQ